jgi:agmatinase
MRCLLVGVGRGTVGRAAYTGRPADGVPAQAHPSGRGPSRAVSTFLGVPGCPPVAADLAVRGTRAAFLGAPVDTQVVPDRPGTMLAPAACRAASQQFAGNPVLEHDLVVGDWWRLADCGDAALGVGDIARAHATIGAAVGAILDAGALPVLCGGDHSVPIAAMPALAARVAGPIGFLSIDAHLDTADDVAGERMTMASPVARVLEHPNVRPRNVAVLGARGLTNSADEIANARRLGVRVFPMADVLRDGLEPVLQEALDTVWDGVEAVYVSFDNDAADASVAPGTTAPEPFGFTSRELLRVAEAIGARGVGLLDVVELSPPYDPAGITARLDCCFVVYLLCAYARALEAGTATPPPYAAWRA